MRFARRGSRRVRETGGYTLHSILVDFDKKPSSSGNLTVVLREKDGDNDNPSLTGSITLNKPGNLGSPGTKTFTAPANTTLTKETTYYVSIIDGGSSNRGEVRTAADDGEDSGALTGWSIGNDMHTYTAADGWDTSTDSILIAVRIARAPDAPANLRTGIGADRLGLFWHAPLYDGGTAVTKYRHRHKASSASSWGAWTETTDAADHVRDDHRPDGRHRLTTSRCRRGTRWTGDRPRRSAPRRARDCREFPSRRLMKTASDSLWAKAAFRFLVSSDMVPASDLTVNDPTSTRKATPAATWATAMGPRETLHRHQPRRHDLRKR